MARSKKKKLGLSILLGLLLVVALTAMGNNVGVIVDAGGGLMWVADSQFAVNSGLSGRVLLTRVEAEELISSMNSGEVRNFGFTDWRLPSVPELRRLAEPELSGRIFGSVRELQRFLARSEVRTGGGPNNRFAGLSLRADGSDLVYAWPVRAQGSGSNGVVLLATNSLHLKKDSSISGDVIVNDASFRPQLEPGVEAQIDKNTSITGSLIADSIGADGGVSTAETLCNEIQGAGPLACENLPDALSLPVVGLPPFQGTESDTSTAGDVSVGNNQSTTLAAGTFRDLNLGKNASVCFAGGVYDVRSIAGDKDANFVFQEATQIRVDGRIVLAKGTFVGADAGSFGCDDPPAGAVTPTAADIVFFGAGSDVVGGDPAFKVDKDNNVNANIYVPGGTAEFGKNTDLTGAVIARDLLLNSGSTVSLDSFFSIEPPSTMPTADPQDAFTNGDTNLEIILSGSDPQSDNLSFSISVPPGAAGSIVSGPTAIQGAPSTFCSVTQTQGCSVDADCPGVEACSFLVFPPIASASVTYDPVDATDAFNSFTFKVTNGSGEDAAAVVDINPGGDPTPDPPAIGTVEAVAGDVETTVGTTLTIQLSGNAPCDTFDEDPESATFGQCLVGVDLGFAIESGCSGTACSSPSNGSLANLTEDGAAVTRTATVDYTPTGPAGTTDSFEFEVCGTIPGTGVVCDRVTVTVSTEAPLTLAENIEMAIEANQEVDIPLVGNSGGAGGAASLVIETMNRRGPGPDRSGGFRAQTTAGRLVYLGSDPSSDQHDGSGDFGTGNCSITTTTTCSNDGACPGSERCVNFAGLPNAASQLAANAATWAGNDSNPSIACVEGDSTFGSHVEEILTSEGLSCASVIAVADLNTASLGAFDVLYTGAASSAAHVQDLVDATSNVQSFVDGGGGLVAETNVFAAGSWTWVPFQGSIGHTGTANIGGMDVTIVDETHPVIQELDNEDLSDWGTSVHTNFLTPGAAGFQVVAEGEDANGSLVFKPYIIVLDPGVPSLVFTITSLPQFGTLKDSSGALITSVPTTLSNQMVTYKNTSPAVGDSFSYQVVEGVISSSGIVALIINDGCTQVGRDPGCSPNGQ